MDNNKKIQPEIWQFARTEHNFKKNDYLESTAELVRHYWLPQWKLHLLKLCRKEGRSFEWSVLKRWKITQHTQSLLQDILKAKFDIFFYFFKFFKFLFISQERNSSLLLLWPFLKFPIGQSRDFDQHTALYFLYPFFHN